MYMDMLFVRLSQNKVFAAISEAAIEGVMPDTFFFTAMLMRFLSQTFILFTQAPEITLGENLDNSII